MILNHKSNAEIGGEAPHRSGGISFHYLLTGKDGAKDNYVLALVGFEDEYETPRHRHNFEQVRIMLEGTYEWSPGVAQEEGSIGYFCEGTHYTQNGTGHSVTLLLQVAGASGDGYMSHRQLREGGAKLQKTGEFHNGIYTWVDEKGTKHNKDGYEAVWEDLNKKKIRYPEPRYDQPIMFRPENFQYLSIRGVPGVYEKNMGRFNERGLLVKQIKMDAGASYEVDGRPQSLLFYVITGEGKSDGEKWGPESAFQVERDEIIKIEAETPSEFYVMGLPVFDD